MTPTCACHPRVSRGWRLPLLAGALLIASVAGAAPYIPDNDAQVIAELPAGARHSNAATRDLARTRLDVALPMTQFYIQRARSTGDLRFLGYADATLAPWLARQPVAVPVIVLHATILQSRHSFDAALAELDRALALKPDDAQAWLTRATVLRVLGRYAEAAQSCTHLAAAADPEIASLCTQSLRGLSGSLPSAYAGVTALSDQSLAPEARAWRFSELAEMAERLGDDKSAERWFRAGLALAPEDFYLRTAYADLLLRQVRPAETLTLLSGYETMEPMLLRIAIARKALGQADSPERALLASAFEVERQRGDPVHRRELARFFLDVDPRPAAALAAARENWQVQKEPDDIIIFLRAAQAANDPAAAAPARQFLAEHRLEDQRVAALNGVGR